MPDALPCSPPSPAVDPAIVDLLALFSGPLSAVRFPDVDKDTLHELAASVERAQAEVEEARAQLSDAEATLETRRLELLIRAQRAKAYARVYAEGHTELQPQLDGIVLPRPGPRALAAPPVDGATEPRRRGRPRKTLGVDAARIGGGVLFGGDASEEAPAAE